MKTLNTTCTEIKMFIKCQLIYADICNDWVKKECLSLLGLQIIITLILSALTGRLVRGSEIKFWISAN